MAKIGAGELDDGVDNSVPGIEASDLNDGDIIARTREEARGDGTFRFVYIPVDGTENIYSDYIQQDFKNKAIMGWLDGVKGQLIGRGMQKLEQARDRAKEERLATLRDLPTEDIADTPAANGKPQHTAAAAQRRKHDSDTEGVDPGRYVNNQLDQARDRLAAAEEELERAREAVIKERAAFNKWQRLSDALEPGGASRKPSSDGNGRTILLK